MLYACFELLRVGSDAPPHPGSLRLSKAGPIASRFFTILPKVTGGFLPQAHAQLPQQVWSHRVAHHVIQEKQNGWSKNTDQDVFHDHDKFRRDATAPVLFLLPPLRFRYGNVGAEKNCQ